MKFISKQKNCFIWPGSEDQYVYAESEILCELEPPSPAQTIEMNIIFRMKAT